MAGRIFLGAILAVFVAGTASAASPSPFDKLQNRIERTLNKFEKQLNQDRPAKPKSRKVAPEATVGGSKAKDAAAKTPAPKAPEMPPEVAAIDKEEAPPLPRVRPAPMPLGFAEYFEDEKTIGGYLQPSQGDPGAALADKPTEAPPSDTPADAGPAADTAPAAVDAAPAPPETPPAADAGMPLPRINPRIAALPLGDKPGSAPLKTGNAPVRLAALPPAIGDLGTGIAKLNALGVVAKQLPAISESACGMPDPVAIASLDDGGIPFSGQATVNRRIAATVATWVRDTVEPSARDMLKGELNGLKIVDSYSCRTRDHIKNAKLSEHAFGNAIDIAAFKIGKTWIDVGGSHSPDQQQFLDKVRAAACGPFTTVLGPGSDGYHADHFHLDLASRNRNGKSRGLYCH